MRISDWSSDVCSSDLAEFLKISYLDVLLMAVIPTSLFYLALFLMVEIDVRKYGMGAIVFKKVDTVWNLTRHNCFHFLSLIYLVGFMMWGFSPVRPVFWAVLVSFRTRPEQILVGKECVRTCRHRVG